MYLLGLYYNKHNLKRFSTHKGKSQHKLKREDKIVEGHIIYKGTLKVCEKWN